MDNSVIPKLSFVFLTLKFTCSFSSGEISEEHPVLLFANRKDIRKIDLVTLENVPLVTNLNRVAAVDYDFQTGTILWSDLSDSSIKSAFLDTETPVVTIIDDDIDVPHGIAVDWIYDHLYWTDSGRSTIEMADMRGNNRKILIGENLGFPGPIVLNPLDGWLYWIDLANPAKIERAGMDGSHRSTVVTSIHWPNGLAIDIELKQIFWTEAKYHVISCADFNGENRRKILYLPLVLANPFSIDVFGDWIYFSDWEYDAIYKINKFDPLNRTEVVGASPSSLGIRIYHRFKQPDGENYCETLHSSCSHLCVPSPVITGHSSRYACLCPNGMTLQEDGATCVTTTSESSVRVKGDHGVESSGTTLQLWTLLIALLLLCQNLFSF